MIHFNSVDKNFGNQIILSDASFSVFAKERVGVVGPNGAGKSTIFNLLMGELTPDAGSISVPENLRMAYVHQHVNLSDTDISVIDYTMDGAIPELKKLEMEIHAIENELAVTSSVNCDNLVTRLGKLQTQFEELGGYQLKSRSEAILCGLGFRKEQLTLPMRTFSGGWKIRAELAKNLVSDPDVLLLDEPTNYLDIPAVEWLQDFLRRFQGTMLLISHDRFLLNLLTTKTIEVLGGKTTIYEGNFQYYIEERQLRYEHQCNAVKNQEKRQEKIEEFIERFRYKASKANQVQSRIKQLERMEEINVDISQLQAYKIILPEPPPCGTEVWRCRELTFGYEGKPVLFSNLDLSVQKGDKISIIGLNGLGKTTLLRLVVDHLQPLSGTRTLGSRVVIGYQGQDYTEVMDPYATVFEIAKQAAEGIRKEAEIRQILGSFRFSGNAIEKQVGVLSGGEKVRLALARLLLSPCNFIVLDEPTTHLDIGTREALEDALKHYAGTVLFVSHDITFVRNVATTIWALDYTGLTKYYGGYDYYCEKRREMAQASAVTMSAESAGKDKIKPSSKSLKREQAELRQELSKKKGPLEKKIEETEQKIFAWEEEQEEILGKFSDPSFKLSEVEAKRLAELKQLIAQGNEQWESLAEELEQLQEFYKKRMADLEMQ